MRGDRPIGTARALRRRSTDAETKLWARLRNRQLDGLKFKRQFAIGPYVADFACPEHHLIIELDGSQHDRASNNARDAARTSQLEAMGYTVLRFWNIDVLKNMDGVLTTILDQLGRLEPPHPIPLPSGEREPGVKVGAEAERSEQALGQEAQADRPASPRPGGERARVRGFQTQASSNNPQANPGHL